MNDDTELKLKNLILDEDFTNLQNLASEEVNLMDILKVSEKELQHSNFLAWFFDPKGSHNLNDFALKEFIKIYFKENKCENLAGLSVFDFVQLDFDDLEIHREYKNIDLIFLSRKNKFCIIIENKIKSAEIKGQSGKAGQLERYRNIIEIEYPSYKHKIYIFLSLEDQQISDDAQEHWIQLNYDHIIKLLEQVLTNRRLKLAEKTKFVFEQYLQTLKSMLNKNEEIEEIAQNLYKKYRSAFDLVLKYAGESPILNKINELIDSEKTIRRINKGKYYVKFQPDYFQITLETLKQSGILSKVDKISEGSLLLFEFNLKNDQAAFTCLIGPGEQAAREKIYDICKKHSGIFTATAKKDRLSQQYHQIFQKRILSKSEFQQYLNDEKSGVDKSGVDKLIETRFEDLIKRELPNIIGCINQEIK